MQRLNHAGHTCCSIWVAFLFLPGSDNANVPRPALPLRLRLQGLFGYRQWPLQDLNLTDAQWMSDRTEQELAAVDTAAEKHPEGQKKAKSTASKSRARRGPEMVGVPFEVMIPIMINIKPLECGEELVVYKPKKQAPGKKPTQPVALKRLLEQAWEQETKEAKEQEKKGRVAL